MILYKIYRVTMVNAGDLLTVFAKQVKKNFWRILNRWYPLCRWYQPEKVEKVWKSRHCTKTNNMATRDSEALLGVLAEPS